MFSEYDKDEFEILDLYDIRISEYEEKRKKTSDFTVWGRRETPYTPEGYRRKLFDGLQRGERFVLTKYLGNSEEVTVPDGVTDISAQVFEKKEFLRRIFIPDSVETIGKGAFEHSTGLVEARLGDNISEVPANVFRGCTALEKVYLGKNTTSLDRFAFEGCSALKSIRLPESLETISRGVFDSCGLEEIYIPKKVKEIASGAFSYCNNIKKIEVDPENARYYSRDNCVFDSERLCLCVGLNDGKIPDDGSVTSIESAAFEGNRRVREVFLPNTIKNLGAAVFRDCENLKHVTFSSALQSIDTLCFAMCTALKEIVVPGNIEIVGDFAFANSGLTRIVFKRGVRQLGEDVLFRCYALREVYIPSSATDVDYGMFLFDSSDDMYIYIEASDERDIDSYDSDIGFLNAEFILNSDIFD